MTLRYGTQTHHYISCKRAVGGGVRLHDFLHIKTDFSGRFRSTCLTQFIQIRNRRSSQIRRNRLMWFPYTINLYPNPTETWGGGGDTRFKCFLDMMSTSPSKHNDIQ